MFFLALCLLLTSCEYRRTDFVRGLHPVEHKGVRSIFVQNNKVGDAFSVYRSDNLSVPMWCSVKKEHNPFMMNFNANFINSKILLTPTNFVCYSGEEPSVDDKELGVSSIVEVNHGIKPVPFIEEAYSPYSKFYLLGVVLSAKVDELFPVYFHLYREICTDQSKISCCMVNNGENIVFDIMLENTDGVNALVSLMDRLRRFINVKGLSENDVKAGFNIFSSMFMDKCSYERWYYDSLYVGVVRPETFLQYKNWLSYYKNSGMSELKIKGIGIKIIDSKKLSSQEMSVLKDSAKKLISDF